MSSKGVTDRQRIAEAIVAAALTHAKEVDQRLQELLAPALLEGQSLPDLASFQEVLAQYLRMRVADLVAADEAHIRELDGDLEPRRRRDAAAAALSAALSRIRAALIGLAGREGVRELVGLPAPPATEPVKLLREGNRVLERLRAAGPGFAALSLDGIQVDPQALAEQIQPALDDLAGAVQELRGELRKTESTLLAKDTALDAFDSAIRGIGRILAGLDQLARLFKFAGKVRLGLPSRRRRDLEEPDAPASPSPETPAPDEP